MSVAIGTLAAIAGFILLVVGGALKDTLSDLLKQEIGGWLEVLPFTLLRIACRRVPKPSRDDLFRDWSADLAALLRDRAEGRPLTRLLVGIHFSASLIRGSRRTARELGSTRTQEAPMIADRGADLEIRDSFERSYVRIESKIYQHRDGIVADNLDPEVTAALAAFEQALSRPKDPPT